MREINLKKAFLYTLIASVVTSAAIGIAVIVLGGMGETAGRILGTTMTITMTSILGLACGAFYETGRGRWVPLGGMAFSVFAAALWITFIWNEPSEANFFVRVAFTATLLAVTLSLLSLLSLARFDARFDWVRTLTWIFVWAFCAFLFGGIWDFFDQDTDLSARIAGVLSITVASLTVLTPVLHRLSSQKADAADIDAEIARLKDRIAELEKQRSELGEADRQKES